MSFLDRRKKCDLLVLAKEFDLEVVDKNMTVGIESEFYDEEFVKALFDTIINARKEDEIREAERSASEAKIRKWNSQQNRGRKKWSLNSKN